MLRVFEFLWNCFIIHLIFIGAQASAQTLSCQEILQKSYPEFWLITLSENYYNNPQMAPVLLALGEKGVSFHFIDSSLGHHAIERVDIYSTHPNGLLTPHQIEVRLPKDLLALSNQKQWEIQSELMILNRVLDLHKQGARFTWEEGALTLKTIDEGFKVTDPTLHTLRYMFRRFQLNQLVFEGRESQWESVQAKPDRAVTLPVPLMDQIWVRKYFLFRDSAWSELPYHLEMEFIRHSHGEPRPGYH